MKKILTILGAITLTASAGLTVVACGSTKTPPIPPTDETIREYKIELNNIWNTVYNQNSDKFVREIKTSGDFDNYSLFNFNYLNEKYAGDGNKVFDLFDNIDNQDNKTMLISDFNLLFPQQEFASLVQSNLATGSNSVKYRNIYMGSPEATLGNFKISENEAFTLTRVHATNTVTGAKELIYSISVTVSKDMYYKNIQGNTEFYNTAQIPLKLLIGREGKTISFIDKVSTNLPKTMINSGSTNFTSSNIKKVISNFKTYSSSLDVSLHTLINKIDFQNTISNNIEEINEGEFDYKLSYGSKIADPSGIKVVSEMIQNNTETKQQLETKTLYDLQRNPLANSLILKKTETEVLEEKLATSMIEEVIGNVNEKIISYEDKLKVLLDLYISDKDLKNSLIANAYSFGYFRLQNISVELDDNTKIELPTIVVPWTYQNDTLRNGRTATKKEGWLYSIYEALKIVNNDVIKANSNLFTYPGGNDGFHEGIFPISDAVIKNFKESFSKPWNSIVSSVTDTRFEDLSTKRLKEKPLIPKYDIWNYDSTTGVVTLDLVGNAKSNNTDNAVVKNKLYDFDSFSAKIEGIHGYDKRENTLTPTDTLRTSNGVNAYNLRVYKENYNSESPYNNTSSLMLSGSKNHFLVPNINNYKFNLGWINFDLFLPFDDGEWLDNFIENSDQTWRGEKYFELSNDRSLFADSTNINHFNWNALNPYKFDTSGSLVNEGFYRLEIKTLFAFAN